MRRRGVPHPSRRRRGSRCWRAPRPYAMQPASSRAACACSRTSPSASMPRKGSPASSGCCRRFSICCRSASGSPTATGVSHATTRRASASGKARAMSAWRTSASTRAGGRHRQADQRGKTGARAPPGRTGVDRRAGAHPVLRRLVQDHHQLRALRGPGGEIAGAIVVNEDITPCRRRRRSCAQASCCCAR